MHSNYSLFYTFDGDRPARFREARVFGTTVWTASGAAMTWGEETRNDYASEAEAHAVYLAHGRAALADGYALARSTVIDPAVFDFALLQTLVADAARRAVEAARRAHPGQHIDAFALVSDDSAMTIGPMANSREALAASEYGEEMLWNPAEWAFEDGGAYFDSAYRLLLQAHRDLPFDVDFAAFRSGVFDACIAALARLDAEGVFGTGAQRDESVLLFEVSDSEAVESAMARLNPPAVVARFEAWMASWAD
ncbi:DUF4303 domain-containing protein [Janthinobacterium kumbetense]|uniref:DUF4303 domain-containing protein n=1 Tax=Janthinobacterium kumbetense TaxID=2950280 RepID=A0ABT0WMP1_9BURK|nr:DUF4303 domain-containing protein [Janthinobacterium kumbetense]MCM2564528.1 DUF4303 domain-containing protein [Janthinobacterium kumbetense]